MSTDEYTFGDFCEDTQMDYEDYGTKDAWEAFLSECPGPHEFSKWWADNQGRFV